MLQVAHTQYTHTINTWNCSIKDMYIRLALPTYTVSETVAWSMTECSH